MDGVEAGGDAWGPLRLRGYVLDRLRQGLCVYDGQRRLLLWNRRYQEMYRLDPADLRVGMTLPEVVDLRFAAGTGPDMTPTEYVAWRDTVQVQQEASDTVVVLRNGHDVTEQQIKDFAAARLAPYKVPRQVVFMFHLPKGATGKVQRVGLAGKLGLGA